MFSALLAIILVLSAVRLRASAPDINFFICASRSLRTQRCEASEGAAGALGLCFGEQAQLIFGAGDGPAARVLQQLQNASAATVTLQSASLPAQQDALQAVLEGRVPGRGPYHAYILNGLQTAAAVESGAAQDLSEVMLALGAAQGFTAGSGPAWRDSLLPAVRGVTATFGGRLVAVPAGSSAALLYYRRDLFAAAGLSAPRTWAEAVEAAALFNGTDLDDDGHANDWGICLWQQQESGTAAGSSNSGGCSATEGLALMAVLAPLVQTNGTSSGLYFDGGLALAAGGMRSVVPTPAWETALTILRDLSIYAPPPGLSPALGSSPAAVAAAADCTYQPLFSQSTAAVAGAQRLLVNQAPSAALGGGLGVYLDRRPGGAEQMAAYLLVAQALSLERSWELVASPLFPYGPTRIEHVSDSSGTMDTWLRYGYHPADLHDYLEASAAALASPNLATDLRSSGGAAAAWSQLLRHTLPLVANASLPLPEVVSASRAAYRSLFSVEALADMRLPYAASIRPLDIGAIAAEPRATPSPPAPAWRPGAAAGGSRSGGGGGGTGAGPSSAQQDGDAASKYLAEGLGVGLAGAAALLALGFASLVLLRTHRQRRMHALNDSTRLWELLPAAVMDAAIHVHHNCIRRGAAALQGYESGTEGDSFLLAFHTAQNALVFCLRVQEELVGLAWPEELLQVDVCRPVWVTDTLPAAATTGAAARLPALDGLEAAQEPHAGLAEEPGADQSGGAHTDAGAWDDAIGAASGHAAAAAGQAAGMKAVVSSGTPTAVSSPDTDPDTTAAGEAAVMGVFGDDDMAAQACSAGSGDVATVEAAGGTPLRGPLMGHARSDLQRGSQPALQQAQQSAARVGMGRPRSASGAVHRGQGASGQGLVTRADAGGSGSGRRRHASAAELPVLADAPAAVVAGSAVAATAAGVVRGVGGGISTLFMSNRQRSCVGQLLSRRVRSTATLDQLDQLGLDIVAVTAATTANNAAAPPSAGTRSSARRSGAGTGRALAAGEGPPSAAPTLDAGVGPGQGPAAMRSPTLYSATLGSFVAAAAVLLENSSPSWARPSSRARALGSSPAAVVDAATAPSGGLGSGPGGGATARYRRGQTLVGLQQQQQRLGVFAVASEYALSGGWRAWSLGRRRSEGVKPAAAGGNGDSTGAAPSTPGLLLASIGGDDSGGQRNRALASSARLGACAPPRAADNVDQALASADGNSDGADSSFDELQGDIVVRLPGDPPHPLQRPHPHIRPAEDSPGARHIRDIAHAALGADGGGRAAPTPAADSAAGGQALLLKGLDTHQAAPASAILARSGNSSLTRHPATPASITFCPMSVDELDAGLGLEVWRDGAAVAGGAREPAVSSVTAAAAAAAHGHGHAAAARPGHRVLGAAVEIRHAAVPLAASSPFLPDSSIEGCGADVGRAVDALGTPGSSARALGGRHIAMAEDGLEQQDGALPSAAAAAVDEASRQAQRAYQPQPHRAQRGPQQLLLRGLRVRMGIHSGVFSSADAVEGAAAGGMVVLSSATHSLITAGCAAGQPHVLVRATSRHSAPLGASARGGARSQVRRAAEPAYTAAHDSNGSGETVSGSWLAGGFQKLRAWFTRRLAVAPAAKPREARYRRVLSIADAAASTTALSPAAAAVALAAPRTADAGAVAEAMETSTISRSRSIMASAKGTQGAGGAGDAAEAAGTVPIGQVQAVFWHGGVHVLDEHLPELEIFMATTPQQVPRWAVLEPPAGAGGDSKFQLVAAGVLSAPVGPMYAAAVTVTGAGAIAAWNVDVWRGAAAALWREAAHMCSDLGGFLATTRDAATRPPDGFAALPAAAPSASRRLFHPGLRGSRNSRPSAVATGAASSLPGPSSLGDGAAGTDRMTPSLFLGSMPAGGAADGGVGVGGTSRKGMAAAVAEHQLLLAVFPSPVAAVQWAAGLLAYGLLANLPVALLLHEAGEEVWAHNGTATVTDEEHFFSSTSEAEDLLEIGHNSRDSDGGRGAIVQSGGGTPPRSSHGPFTAVAGPMPSTSPQLLQQRSSRVLSHSSRLAQRSATARGLEGRLHSRTRRSFVAHSVSSAHRRVNGDSDDLDTEICRSDAMTPQNMFLDGGSARSRGYLSSRHLTHSPHSFLERSGSNCHVGAFSMGTNAPAAASVLAGATAAEPGSSYGTGISGVGAGGGFGGAGRGGYGGMLQCVPLHSPGPTSWTASVGLGGGAGTEGGDGGGGGRREGGELSTGGEVSTGAYGHSAGGGTAGTPSASGQQDLDSRGGSRKGSALPATYGHTPATPLHHPLQPLQQMLLPSPGTGGSSAASPLLLPAAGGLVHLWGGPASLPRIADVGMLRGAGSPAAGAVPGVGVGVGLRDTATAPVTSQGPHSSAATAPTRASASPPTQSPPPWSLFARPDSRRAPPGPVSAGSAAPAGVHMAWNPLAAMPGAGSESVASLLAAQVRSMGGATAAGMAGPPALFTAPYSTPQPQTPEAARWGHADGPASASRAAADMEVAAVAFDARSSRATPSGALATFAGGFASAQGAWTSRGQHSRGLSERLHPLSLGGGAGLMPPPSLGPFMRASYGPAMTVELGGGGISGCGARTEQAPMGRAWTAAASPRSQDAAMQHGPQDGSQQLQRIIATQQQSAGLPRPLLGSPGSGVNAGVGFGRGAAMGPFSRPSLPAVANSSIGGMVSPSVVPEALANEMLAGAGPVAVMPAWHAQLLNAASEASFHTTSGGGGVGSASRLAVLGGYAAGPASTPPGAMAVAASAVAPVSALASSRGGTSASAATHAATWGRSVGAQTAPLRATVHRSLLVPPHASGSDADAAAASGQTAVGPAGGEPAEHAEADNDHVEELDLEECGIHVGDDRTSAADERGSGDGDGVRTYRAAVAMRALRGMGVGTASGNDGGSRASSAGGLSDQPQASASATPAGTGSGVGGGGGGGSHAAARRGQLKVSMSTGNLAAMRTRGAAGQSAGARGFGQAGAARSDRDSRAAWQSAGGEAAAAGGEVTGARQTDMPDPARGEGAAAGTDLHASGALMRSPFVRCQRATEGGGESILSGSSISGMDSCRGISSQLMAAQLAYADPGRSSGGGVAGGADVISASGLASAAQISTDGGHSGAVKAHGTLQHQRPHYLVVVSGATQRASARYAPLSAAAGAQPAPVGGSPDAGPPATKTCLTARSPAAVMTSRSRSSPPPAGSDPAAGTGGLRGSGSSGPYDMAGLQPRAPSQQHTPSGMSSMLPPSRLSMSGKPARPPHTNALPALGPTPEEAPDPVRAVEAVGAGGMKTPGVAGAGHGLAGSGATDRAPTGLEVVTVRPSASWYSPEPVAATAAAAGAGAHARDGGPGAEAEAGISTDGEQLSGDDLDTRSTVPVFPPDIDNAFGNARYSGPAITAATSLAAASINGHVLVSAATAEAAMGIAAAAAVASGLTEEQHFAYVAATAAAATGGAALRPSAITATAERVSNSGTGILGASVGLHPALAARVHVQPLVQQQALQPQLAAVPEDAPQHLTPHGSHADKQSRMPRVSPLKAWRTLRRNAAQQRQQAKEVTERKLAAAAGAAGAATAAACQ
ncbi:hypothetical protein HXX76_007722 [Chlamydomonas incerta]|uniref:Guanylate cyclase domain-containing protein n=1 Tax=Chlamydomonas incerta TaxID=51695 RepID=A0A835T0I3_CHLIN|nr:hypothetical protein HXX76_007722 [Chlamydomonas incerta]|eukprot:KAG2434837.1 hypothetical protein HXX76_007722 [Chlamydomonas incerta]